MSDKDKNINNKFYNSKLLINEKIYIFLIFLIREIFLRNRNKSNSRKISNKVKELVNKINKILIGEKNKDKHINIEYSKKNFQNIINFVKGQNSVFAGEIIENILIIVFSFSFKTNKENFFGKYLYNDLSKIKDSKFFKLADWFLNEFKENIDLKKFLENDIKKGQNENEYNNIQKGPFFDFLNTIYYEKKISNKALKINFLSYIMGTIVFFEKIKNRNINNNDSTSKTKSTITTTINTSELSNFFFENDIGKIKKYPIRLVRALFISIYIYYQNKNSPLMKYIKKKKDKKGKNLKEKENSNELENIPFVFDLSEAKIDSQHAGVIFAPLRNEPRVNEIKMTKNSLKKEGLLELSKVLLFNQNIKKIDFDFSMLKSQNLELLNFGLKLFNNYSVEVLNLSSNYLKEDSADYLASLLLHFKNLKTINLSSNDLKRGISSFLIVLKNLYRQDKTNLEILDLKNCLLDDISFYELGELIKCKYCKLKKLYLNENNIPSSVNFLKKLKKNRILTEIYFNKSNISNNDTDDIMRIMSNTNIDYLYLNKNKIYNFDNLLRIIYRTKLIKDNEEKKNEKIYQGEPYLYNIDLSYNDCYNKNKDKIEILKDGIKETTIYFLDISHILYGLYPKKMIDLGNNLKNHQKSIEVIQLKNYIKSVEELKKELEEEQIKYNKTIWEINKNEIKNKKIDNIKNKELFKNMEEDINNIIKHEKSKYPVFIKEQARNLICKTKETRDIVFKDNNLNKEEFKKLYKDLENYIILKKKENEQISLKESKEKKKMIII